MIQTHKQLLIVSEEYNTLFSKNEFYPLQKAYTTPHFLVLGLRFPGRSLALYIGRGNQYEGIFVSDKFPPSYLRVQDRLLDYTRRYLVGTRLGKMEIDEKHSLALFHFKNEHTDNAFAFGYKDRQLYFIKQNKEEVYTSWNGEINIGKSITQLLDDLMGTKNTVDQVSQVEWSLDQYFENEEKKISGKPIQKKKEKFLEKKLKNITEDLIQAEKWQLIEDELLSEEIEFNEERNLYYGHKVKFGTQLNLWQKRNVVFGKIKKLKRAENILNIRKVEVSDELIKVKIGDFEFETTKEKVIAPLWQSAGAKKVKNSKEQNVKYFKINKLNGIISLDAESNDWLRSHGSKESKDHLWFHIEGYPGAHCLINTSEISQISGLEMSAIGSMLRDYSKLKITVIPLIFSQLKNIKGLKGEQGKVLVNKAKHLQCNYMNWIEIITII
jgi:hypothetical protein